MIPKIYIFFGQCILLCSEYIFGNVEAMIGRKVRNAHEGEFPFIVSIVRTNLESPERNLNHICTGSLISAKDVLSVEQCYEEYDKGLHIVSESVDRTAGIAKYINWWITFNTWNEPNVKSDELFEENDLAIARLLQTVTGRIFPAVLSYMSNYDYFGINVEVAGWGLDKNGVKPNILQTMGVKILSSSMCKRKIEDIVKKKVKINPKLICSCGESYALIQDGDIGGPLMYKGAIVGINRSTSPITEAKDYHKKVNLHYSIEWYREFIASVTNNV